MIEKKMENTAMLDNIKDGLHLQGTGIKTTGIALIDMLQQTDPDRHITEIAIDRLKTTGDIVRFFDAYVAYLKKYDGRESLDSEKQYEDRAAYNLKLALDAKYGIGIVGRNGAQGFHHPTVVKWLTVIQDVSTSEYTRKEVGLRR